MKRLALLSVLIFLLTNLIYSQDIINETGKDGKFIVRDAEQKEALVIENGNIEIRGTLSIDSLAQGSEDNKVVVWSETDKQFKALYNLIPKSSINASVMAADSWTESSGNVYRASGNVGIGISTPIYPLTVYRSGANASVVTSRDGGAMNYMNAAATHGTFGTVNNFPTRIAQNAQIKMFIDANNNGIYFGSTGNVTSSTDPDIDVAINSDGNIGIGTNTPKARLHVVGNHEEGFPTFKAGTMFAAQQNTIGNWVHIAIIGATDGVAGINFGDKDSDEAGYVRYYNFNNGLEFGTNGAERMRITSGGNVGIGTKTPGFPLHIHSSYKPWGGNAVYHIKLETGYGWWTMGVDNESGDADFLFRSSEDSDGYTARIEPASGSWEITSDRRLKKNILPLANVLDKIQKLEPVTFHRLKQVDNEMFEIGFIAQDVHKLFPNTKIAQQKGEYWSMTYDNFGPIAIAGIKELKIEKDKEIEELKSTIEQLLVRIENLENN